MTGQLCPECGTPQDAYGRPGADCDCAERAAIAAAEDFDPLRIRPYVTLENQDGAVPTIPPPPPPIARAGDTSEGADPAETMRLSLPGLRTRPPGAGSAGGAAAEGDRERRGGRRTFAMAALAAAAVAVIGTASFAGGLFTDDGSDEATGELNSGLPTASVRPESSAPKPKSPSGAGTDAAGSASADASVRASASPTESAAPETSGPAGGPGAPSEAPTQTGQPGGAGATREAGTDPAGAVDLRLGDSGPQVEELQRRLSEVWLYHDGYDGRFGERVEAALRIYQSYKHIQGDPSGVYGAHTRGALEAETSGKGRDQGGGGRPGDGGQGNGPGWDWRD
ncbi:peptidoglycan-binding protein [Streptomyces sp. NBC_01498]|uniref:peptidoglycan-binding domain-containing protein n=1 Tax=Streptomyces sp. NBC_01498 TaxID=2975870 RepID=UPI002E7BC73F|nr:peptidoglycan-binding protein [Streptomyces sp. NBC_01498]WTL27113.1 peptidoglycan-binding protein [Streptomyces sp. NBC_01498]